MEGTPKLPETPQVAESVAADAGVPCPLSTAGHFPIYRSGWACSLCHAILKLGVWYAAEPARIDGSEGA